MPTHAELIAEFRAGLASGVLPPGVTARDPAEAARRFAVYRNNVAHSLSRALASRYPVIERLVGEDFFRPLAAAFFAEHQPWLLGRLHQRLRKLGRDQKADLLAIEPLGNVDAQHAACVVHGGAAAHAGVECTAKKDARVKAALDQPVVGALGHRKANVQRVAQRVDALALRQWVGGGAKAQHRRCCRAPLGAQHGQVALHVKRQQLHLALLPLHRHVHAPVALGLQRQLAGHVKVGDDEPIGRHKKARANRRLRVGVAQQRADLHQLVARQLVNAPRIAREQGRIGGGGCGGCSAPRCGC
mgnify:CR=1 FL=1